MPYQKYLVDPPKRVPLTKMRYRFIVDNFQTSVLHRVDYFRDLGLVSERQLDQIRFRLRQLDAAKSGSLQFQEGELEQVQEQGFPALSKPEEGEKDFSVMNQEFIRILNNLLVTPTPTLIAYNENKHII